MNDDGESEPMEKAFTEVLEMAGGKEAINKFMPFWGQGEKDERLEW